MLVTEATFRGQLVIMRMQEREPIFGGCCTWCMLYSVYVQLGVYSSSWDGELESDESTSCSAMIVEWSTRKKDMGDDDGKDVEDTSGCEKSGIQLAWLRWEDLESVLLPTRLELVPSI
jgi:hypothetical protein